MSTLGIPTDAVDFYDDLAMSNTREWWLSNKSRYDESVRTPMTALLDALAPEFGQTYLFRPHRDVRFSADKRPYKDHQGGLCLVGTGMGYYVQVSADGLRIGGGYYPSGKDQLVRQRAAIDAPASGGALATAVEALEAAGYEVGGDQVPTRPRGVPADHPRLDLMRRKSLVVIRAFGEPEWMSTPEVVDHVAAAWREVRPVVDWLVEHVGPTQEVRR